VAPPLHAASVTAMTKSALVVVAEDAVLAFFTVVSCTQRNATICLTRLVLPWTSPRLAW